MKPYPSWVCWDCGTKYQNKVLDGCSTYHDGLCGVCGEQKAVTQPRDFGFPEFPGFERK